MDQDEQKACFVADASPQQESTRSSGIDVAAVDESNADTIEQEANGNRGLKADPTAIPMSSMDQDCSKQLDGQLSTAMKTTTFSGLEEGEIAQDQDGGQGRGDQQASATHLGLEPFSEVNSPPTSQPLAVASPVQTPHLTPAAIKQESTLDQLIKDYQAPTRSSPSERISSKQVYGQHSTLKDLKHHGPIIKQGPNACLDTEHRLFSLHSGPSHSLPPKPDGQPPKAVESVQLPHAPRAIPIDRKQPARPPLCATAANTTPLNALVRNSNKQGPYIDQSLQAREKLLRQAAMASAKMTATRQYSEPKPALYPAVSDCAQPFATSSKQSVPRPNQPLVLQAQPTLQQIGRKLGSLNNQIKGAKASMDTSKTQRLNHEREEVLKTLHSSMAADTTYRYTDSLSAERRDIDSRPAKTSGAAGTSKRRREPSPEDEMEEMTQLITQINRITKRVAGLQDVPGHRRTRKVAAEGLAFALRASAQELLDTVEEVTRK
ncbi:MAG: hypothetical protein Q9168_002860 [Polycauliona sp. 1 TL-2023]